MAAEEAPPHGSRADRGQIYKKKDDHYYKYEAQTCQYGKKKFGVGCHAHMVTKQKRLVQTEVAVIIGIGVRGVGDTFGLSSRSG